MGAPRAATRGGAAEGGAVCCDVFVVVIEGDRPTKRSSERGAIFDGRFKVQRLGRQMPRARTSTNQFQGQPARISECLAVSPLPLPGKSCPHATVLSEENAAAAEDVVQQDEFDEMTKVVTKATSASPGGATGDSTHSASSSSSGAAASSSDARPELPAGIWTREQADEKLPKVKGCGICLHTEGSSEAAPVSFQFWSPHLNPPVGRYHTCLIEFLAA